MHARGPSPSAGGGAPRLSVVIPTRDRPALLARCLAALAAQTLPREAFDVTVVRDGEPGGERPAVPGGLAVRWLAHEAARGPAAARNTGWRATTGDAVVFLDDDVVPAPALLAAAAAALARHGHAIAGVEGTVVPDDPQAAAHPLARTIDVAGGGHGHTCNVAYWRTALEAVDGFDEGFRDAYGEDYDLAFRTADRVGPLVHVAAMRAEHVVYPPPGYVAWQRRRWRAWPALVRLFVRHPARFPPAFLPPRLLAALRPWWRRPTPTAVAGYLLVHAVAAVAHRRALLARRPFTFLRWMAYHLLELPVVLVGLPRLVRAHARVTRERPPARGRA